MLNWVQWVDFAQDVLQNILVINGRFAFYSRDAMLARYLLSSVRPSVCLSQAALYKYGQTQDHANNTMR